MAIPPPWQGQPRGGQRSGHTRVEALWLLPPGFPQAAESPGAGAAVPTRPAEAATPTRPAGAARAAAPAPGFALPAAAPASAAPLAPAWRPRCPVSLRAAWGHRATAGTAAGEGTHGLPAWPGSEEAAVLPSPGCLSHLHRPPRASAKGLSPPLRREALRGSRRGRPGGALGESHPCGARRGAETSPTAEQAPPAASLLSRPLRRNTGRRKRGAWRPRGETPEVAPAQSKAGHEGGKPLSVLSAAGMPSAGVQDQQQARFSSPKQLL